MPEIFFTSDIHKGHKFVAGLRGFDNPQDHDDALAENWVQTVSSKDTVYVLGDLSMASTVTALEPVLAWFDGLPGIKHVRYGNHDPGHPRHSKSKKFEPLYKEVFATTGIGGEITIGKTRFVMSHFPYEDDMRHIADRAGEPDKYAAFRPVDKGHYLLHGHTHTKEIWREGPRELHVGLDAHGLRPVSVDAIAALVDAEPTLRLFT